MKKNLIISMMFMIMPMGVSNASPVQNVLLNDEKDLGELGVRFINGVSISYQEQSQSVSITFNQPCENAEIIIYKDGVPVANEILDNVERGTVEMYDVDDSNDSVITTQVVVDGKDIWVSDMKQNSK